MTRSLVALIAGALAVACGRVVPPPIPVADHAPGVRTFHGRVLLDVGGGLEPLEGVSLRCFWPGGHRDVVTDAEGRFDLLGIPFVSGTVELPPQGYEFAMSGRGCSFAGFDSTERSGDIVVRRGGRAGAGGAIDPPAPGTRYEMAGVVRDVGGRPVAGARVVAEGSGIETTADEAGRFHLFGLPQDTAALRTTAEGRAFPLVDGAAVGDLELQIRAFSGATVAGVVVDAAGEPFPGVVVEVRPDRLDEAERPIVFGPVEEIRTDRSGRSGRFLVGDLPEGPLRVRVRGGRRDYPVGEPLAGVSPGAADLRLVARRTWFETPHRLSGTVVGRGGHPVAGARVEARPAGFGAPSRRDRTSADGRFCLMGLRPGPWSVRVTPAGASEPAFEEEYTDGEVGIRVVLD